ncbi:LacI family DNA-binding transcriptional regulator [Brachybacterium sp. DNPG3]
MAITLRDVAARAEVSVATASRALQRPEMVLPATRDRVQQAAADLGYTVNRSARTLSTGRTGVLGVVVPDLLNPFYPAVLKGAQARARHHGVQLLLADAEETPEGELPLVRTLASQVDGVLLCSPRMDDESLDAASLLTRIALVNRTHATLPAVSADAMTGVRAALRHLAALGHRRIGLVGGPEASHSNTRRRFAVLELATELGLDAVDIGGFAPTTDGGRSAAEAVLLADVGAVLVYNDVMALGLISQLRESGFRVPQDLSVVGWDDIAFAEIADPALSTVRVPRYEMGAAGIDALVEDPDDEVGVRWRFETTFVPRGSTARYTAPTVPAAPSVPSAAD